MKRWSKRLAYCASGLVLVFLLAVLIEHFRGEWALRARLRALGEQGETLSLAQLKPKRPDPAQNLFTDLVALANRHDSIFTNADIAPPSLRLASPGRAVVAAKLSEWSDNGKTTNDWRKLGMGLEQERESLGTLRSAAGKSGYENGFDYDKGFVDFQFPPMALVGVRHSCQLLSWSAIYNLNQGNLEPAHEDLMALVTLTAKQRPEPLIICQLVRQACAAIAFNTTWQALQADGWTDAQLASVQGAWLNCDFAKDMGLAMEMERDMTLDTFRQVRGARKKLDLAIKQRLETSEMLPGASLALPSRGWVLTWLHLPVWRVAWAAQDELAALQQWQFIIGRERSAWTNGWAALSGTKQELELPWRLLVQKGSELGWYDRLRFMFASETSAVTDAEIRRTMQAQTQQQMALTALGIRRYRLRTGKVPERLSDLVPEYLAAAPQDFMNGKTLRYRPRPAEGDFLLYSVGEDGRDDGGNPARRDEKKSYRQIWDGRDAVWPTPASAEETKLAMSPKSHD